VPDDSAAGAKPEDLIFAAALAIVFSADQADSGAPL